MELINSNTTTFDRMLEKEKREKEYFFTILQENRFPAAAYEEELRTVEAGRRELQLDTLAVDMHPLEDTLHIHNNNNNIKQNPIKQEYQTRILKDFQSSKRKPKIKNLIKIRVKTSYLEEEEHQQEAAVDCSNSSLFFFFLKKSLS